MPRRPALQMQQASLVPAAHLGQQHDPQQGHQGKPGHPFLPVGQHNKGGEQWSDGRSRVAANLEDRLCQAQSAAGGKTRHPRGLRMEDSRAHANQRGGQQQRCEGGGDGQQQQADQGKYHADGQGVRHGPAVGSAAR